MFGKNTDKPYIHLNNNVPDNKLFDELWLQTEKASVEGCKIMLMMGGAGGAYQQLFSDFNTFYPLLVKTINDRTATNIGAEFTIIVALETDVSFML